jgi:hypothetical protein
MKRLLAATLLAAASATAAFACRNDNLIDNDIDSTTVGKPNDSPPLHR